MKTNRSCRWMPPSNGSFITQTSPGRIRSPRTSRAGAPSRRGSSRGGTAPSPPARPSRPSRCRRGREVHAVAHDGRVGGAEDRRRHLVGDRRERVAHDLQRDGVDRGPLASAIGALQHERARGRVAAAVQPGGRRRSCRTRRRTSGRAPGSSPIDARERTGTSSARPPKNALPRRGRPRVTVPSMPRPVAGARRAERRQPHRARISTGEPGSPRTP